MNPERIGKLIKDIRTKNNLSQKEFAQKYNVTYQAVSKWETGKNIPDIIILKQICSDYNLSLEELLDAKTKKNYSKKIIFLTIIFICLSIIVLYTITKEKNNTFEFKTLSSTSENFKLTGSIAYDKDKTSIYISDVTYLGKDKDTEYKTINSTLYEIDGKTKKEISTYNKSFLITIESFVSGISFHIDDHASICKEYTEESLLLEISAIDKNDKITKYEIPISVSDNCQK